MMHPEDQPEEHRLHAGHACAAGQLARIVSPTMCRRRGSTGTATTGCSRRRQASPNELPVIDIHIL